MKAFEATQYYFDKAADILDVSPEIRQLLITPRREVRVEIPVEMDNGRLETLIGFRVQHNNYRGPMKGGLRYHHEVDLSIVTPHHKQLHSFCKTFDKSLPIFPRLLISLSFSSLTCAGHSHLPT